MTEQKDDKPIMRKPTREGTVALLSLSQLIADIEVLRSHLEKMNKENFASHSRDSLLTEINNMINKGNELLGQIDTKGKILLSSEIPALRNKYEKIVSLVGFE